jgi:hypothetical protein
MSRVEERNAEEDPDATRVAILKAELKKAEEKIDEKKKKTIRFNGIAVPPLPSWAKTSKNTGKAIDLGIPPMTSIATECATKDVSSKVTIDSRPLSVIPQPTPSTSDKADPTPTNPAQYQYQSAIEDPTVARTLLDHSLDAPIHTTTRELLATSGDLHKQFKEMIMSRRVNANAVLMDSPTPIQSVDSFLNQHGDQYVAEHSLPLRVVFPKFKNRVHPECILDGGAQVIVMRKDIWECLDLPLLTEKIMIMESANNMCNHTLGVV